MRRALWAAAVLAWAAALPAAENSLWLRVALNNPFDPEAGQSTRIDFTRRNSDGPVRLSIYSMDGRLVRVLADAPVAAGATQSALWDGRDADGAVVAGGVYFAVLETDSERLARRVAVRRQ
jgi:hypothetical protein